jgi:hypothetical protein
MAVTKTSAVFWDVTACGSCKNRRFEGTYRLYHQGERSMSLLCTSVASYC